MVEGLDRNTTGFMGHEKPQRWSSGKSRESWQSPPPISSPAGCFSPLSPHVQGQPDQRQAPSPCPLRVFQEWAASPHA